MSLYIILSIVATVLSILAIMKEMIIPLIFKPHLCPTVGTKEEYRAERIDYLQTQDNRNSIAKEDYIKLPPEDTTKIPYTTTFDYSSECAGAVIKYPDVSYNFFRLKIENKACYFTSKADEVYVRILNIYKDKEELKPFNTIKTRWVAESTLSSDLSRGEYAFVNLITVFHEEGKEYYAFPGYLGGMKLALPNGFPKDKLSKAGDFCYRIGIYGKNFNGQIYGIKFHFDLNDKEPISNLICEPIIDKDGVSTCP